MNEVFVFGLGCFDNDAKSDSVSKLPGQTMWWKFQVALFCFIYSLSEGQVLSPEVKPFHCKNGREIVSLSSQPVSHMQQNISTSIHECATITMKCRRNTASEKGHLSRFLFCANRYEKSKNVCAMRRFKRLLYHTQAGTGQTPGESNCQLYEHLPEGAVGHL